MRSLSDASAPKDPATIKKKEEEKGEEVKELSLEERVARAKQLLAAKRAQKEDEESKTETNKEVERRELGKAMQEQKRRREDEEAMKIAQERRKEKEEEKAAREKVKRQIEQDRAERAAKYSQEKEREKQRAEEAKAKKMEEEARKAEMEMIANRQVMNAIRNCDSSCFFLTLRLFSLQLCGPRAVPPSGRQLPDEPLRPRRPVGGALPLCGGHRQAGILPIRPLHHLPQAPVGHGRPGKDASGAGTGPHRHRPHHAGGVGWWNR